MNSFLQRMRAREYDDQDIDSLAKALKTLPQVGMNTESLELLEVYSGVTSWQTAKGELLGDIAKAALASVTAEELKRLRAEPVRQ